MASIDHAVRGGGPDDGGGGGGRRRRGRFMLVTIRYGKTDPLEWEVARFGDDGALRAAYKESALRDASFGFMLDPAGTAAAARPALPVAKDLGLEYGRPGMGGMLRRAAAWEATRVSLGEGWRAPGPREFDGRGSLAGHRIFAEKVGHPSTVGAYVATKRKILRPLGGTATPGSYTLQPDGGAPPVSCDEDELFTTLEASEPKFLVAEDLLRRGATVSSSPPDQPPEPESATEGAVASEQQAYSLVAMAIGDAALAFPYTV
eukprot:SAG22_NODE_665_length_8020_cov_22.612296_12_plen_260_part_01